MVGFVRKINGHTIISWLLTIFAIVALVMSWRTSSNLTQYVQCQAEWNTFLHKALAAGRTANADAQAALDELIVAVSESKSATETRAALDKYKEARAAQIIAQRENPLPEPPEKVCVI